MLKGQHFNIYELEKFHAQLSWEWKKKFYNIGARISLDATYSQHHEKACLSLLFAMVEQYLVIAEIWG